MHLYIKCIAFSFFVFKNHSDDLCLLIEVFSTFCFNVLTFIFGVKSTIRSALSMWPTCSLRLFLFLAFFGLMRNFSHSNSCFSLTIWTCEKSHRTVPLVNVWRWPCASLLRRNGGTACTPASEFRCTSRICVIVFPGSTVAFHSHSLLPVLWRGCSLLSWS